MNANENSSKSDSRMKRIKYMSRFLKILLLSYIVVLGLIAILVKKHIIGGPDLLSGQSEKAKIYEAIFSLLSLLSVIAFYRLLNLYEKGVIFSAENASQIRRLGYLAMAYALLKACNPIFLPNEGVFTIPTALINFLFSPWFFTGCFIIIITWIMDEGRKIQEEQELTV
jgi:hypothetical protein